MNNTIINLSAGGVLLLNKPIGWTSFQAVKKVKYHIAQLTGVRKFKIGHAGTLDPLATGLLIICYGSYTKKIESFQDQEKEYTGTFMLGATTPSADLETEPDKIFPTEHLTVENLNEATKKFIGTFDQMPPVFSAKKINGVRAYKFARKGEEVEMRPKSITIREFELTKQTIPEIDFRVVCSKGTYIRSLAVDFGQAVQSGAYLSALCRTRIGQFKLSDAMNVDNLSELKTEA